MGVLCFDEVKLFDIGQTYCIEIWNKNIKFHKLQRFLYAKGEQHELLEFEGVSAFDDFEKKPNN